MPAKQGPFGGKGGTEWDDLADNPNIAGLLGFIISGTNTIHSFQAVYRTSSGGTWIGNRHGGDTSNTNVANIPPNLNMISIILRTGDRLDNILFELQDGNGGPLMRFGPFGGSGGKDFRQIDMNNIVAFFGRSGSGMDAIGFYTS